MLLIGTNRTSEHVRDPVGMRGKDPGSDIGRAERKRARSRFQPLLRYSFGQIRYPVLSLGEA